MSKNVPLRVFIGVDPRQPLSLTVLNSSIAMRSSKPVAITPLVLHQLPIERKGLTEFTFSRFLAPWLCDYKGWSLFLDADMLLVDDIAKLFDFADDEHSIFVRKGKLKFEWASVMLFNNEKCKMLTPEYIETAKNLHAIGFLPDEEIGELPQRWNHLVGYDKPTNDVSLIHYTQGVPGFQETSDCEHSQIWWHDAAYASRIHESWETVMGGSVHSATDADGKKVPLYKVMGNFDA